MRKSTKDRRDLIPSARPSGAPKSRRKVQYMSQEERLREAEKIEVINKESLGNLYKVATSVLESGMSSLLAESLFSNNS